MELGWNWDELGLYQNGTGMNWDGTGMELGWKWDETGTELG